MTDSLITSPDLEPGGMPAGDPGPGALSNPRLSLLLTWVLPILIVTAGLLYWGLPRLLYPAAPENAPMPVSSAIEAKWGIRITQVAISADGGMVDFRYIILDPNKAQNFAEDAQSTPTLHPDGNRTVVFQTAKMPHKNQLQPGATYFLLYENAAGAVKAQSYLTVQLGDISLAHVPVR
jgi:hypothetical protein